MFPYWVLISLFAAGAVQHRLDQQRRVQGGPLLVGLGLLTALMIGLRYRVGGDWVNYIRIFRDISYRDFVEALGLSDPGYALLNWLAARMNVDIWAVNLVCALIFMWGLVRFARRQPNPWLLMVVAVPYLIIVVGMGYTRQAVAIGLILAGFANLDKGLMRFSGYLLAAVLFHKSALVVLPLVALSASQRRFVTVAILLGSGILLYWLLVRQSIDRFVSVYVDYELQSQGAKLRVLMNLPPAITFLVFQRRFMFTEIERKLWRNFSIAALLAVVGIFVASATTALDRLALYLIPLQSVVFARLPIAFPQRLQANRQLTLLVIAYSAAVQFVWLNFADNANFWVPYRTYLGDRSDDDFG